MALFNGTFTSKVDAKGRVSVPANLRMALAGQVLQGESFRGAALYPVAAGAEGEARALEGVSTDLLEAYTARFDDQDPFNPAENDIRETLFPALRFLNFDDAGRMSLPSNLVEHAGIAGRAAFVGRGNRFQIWNPASYNRHQVEPLRAFRVVHLPIPEDGE